MPVEGPITPGGALSDGVSDADSRAATAKATSPAILPGFTLSLRRYSYRSTRAMDGFDMGARALEDR